jgi:putative LysE/RhtB family amino acid efflux pump
MAPVHALILGLGLGALVAAQVGPISLLLVRSVFRHGYAVGLAIAAAVAIVDMSYAGLGVAGAASLVQIDAIRLTLGLVGAAVLLALGARTAWSAFRVRTGGETDDEVGSPRRAFLTALAATASNPLTIVSWAAVFAGASVAGAVDGTGETVTLIVGIGLGTLTWKSGLTGAVALARRKVGDRTIRIVDAVSGLGLLGFGVLLGWRAAHND